MVQQLIARQPFFRGVSSQILQPLFESVQTRIFQTGETLFWEGDPCSGLFIVQTGSIKLFRTAANGREVIVTLVGPGGSFNEVAVWDGGDNPVSAAALQDSRVLLIPADVVRHQMQAHPELMQAIILSMSQRSRMLVARVAELSALRLVHRLARVLLDLTPEQLAGNQRISQNDLAAMTGTVREVLSRTLKDLARQGVISLERGEIVIQDRDYLEKLAFWSM